MKNTCLLILIALISFACNNKPQKQESSTNVNMLMHKVEIKELIQTTNYTYLFVSEKEAPFWIAVSKAGFNVGEQILYFDNKASEMINFHSKELNRDFDRILFVANYSRENNSNKIEQPAHTNSIPSNQAHSGRKQTEVMKNISIEKADGGITIEELYKNRTKYKNQKVRISGEIMKVNLQIMGRNWVHIQDGTKFGEEYDLTITTQEKMEVGQRIVIEGVVAIDKDFTSGYFYPVIIENAVIFKQL